VRAALDNTRGIMEAAGAVDDERIAVLEAALRATSGDSPERARLLATLAAQLSFSDQRDRRWGLADQALDMATRVGDPATYARVVNMLWYPIAHPTTVEQRVRMTTEAVARSAEQADPAVRHWAHRLHLFSCQETGDLDAIDADLPAVVQFAAASGDPAHMWGTTFIRSWRALLAGDLESSEALAHEAFAWGQKSNSPEAELAILFQLVEIRRAQDRLAEMHEVLARSVAADADAFLGLAASVLALVYCDLGQFDEARRLFRGKVLGVLGEFDSDLAWLPVTAAHAEVCVRLGEVESASALMERLAPWHDQVPSLQCLTIGSVAWYLGMLATILGRHEDAEGHFTEALAVHERMRAPLWIGRVQVEHARMLLARNGPGDAERAAAMLDDAEAAAEQYGFAALSRQVAELGG